MAQKKELPQFNRDELFAEAKKSMDDGAVTTDYPLDVDDACKLLNSALATEIMCVLRYRHHSIIATGIDKPQVAAEFEEHAEEEEKHMLMIAERINQLGGNPDFNPATIQDRTVTQYGAKTDLRGMIEEDLIAERIAISVYRKMIDWFGSEDSTTRIMLEEILKEEEDHAEDLADLLNLQS